VLATELPELARRVKRLRERANMSQQSLAVAAGLSMSMVSLIEQGQRENPRASTLKALARALNVTVDELLLEEGEEKPAPSAEDMPPEQHKPRGRKARRPRGG